MAHIFKTYKVHLKLVRSFGIGVTVYSPTLNSFALDIQVGCFIVALWARGKQWFGATSFWNG